MTRQIQWSAARCVLLERDENIIYIDDIVGFSRTAEERRQYVQLVLDHIAAAALTLNFQSVFEVISA